MKTAMKQRKGRSGGTAAQNRKEKIGVYLQLER